MGQVEGLSIPGHWGGGRAVWGPGGGCEDLTERLPGAGGGRHMNQQCARAAVEQRRAPIVCQCRSGGRFHKEDMEPTQLFNATDHSNIASLSLSPSQ